ncbi:MAG TPA: pseudouridine synthase [Caulobacteraceae bacterium]
MDHQDHPSSAEDAGQPEQSDIGSAESGGERVAKALARVGVASRREVERLIEAGRVALNGKVLTTPAVKVEPGDILTVDGNVVGDAEPTRLFRYHKPTGLLTSHTDPKGRPTVFQNLPEGLPRLISVGRLDLNSEGLLLLTNDGALSRALELPSSGWVRRYRARAFGDASQEKLDRLKNGITVEGVKYGSIDARLDKASGRNVWITVTLTEGKNREVRRVLEALGLKVNRLIRLSYGPFALGTLAQGEVEEVGPRVIRELLEGYISAANMPKGDAVQWKAPKSSPPKGRRGPAVSPPQSASRTAPPAGEHPKKKVYKAGWAKAGKPKTFRGKPKPKDRAIDRPKGPRR